MIQTHFIDAVSAAREAQFAARIEAERQEGFRRMGERIDERKKETEEREKDGFKAVEREIIHGNLELRARRLESRIGLHQQAVIQALLENQRQLDEAEDRIDQMLAEAHVLEDGRRVFKSEDGTRVFDEHGQEIGAEILDPAAIDDNKTRWEQFKAEKDEHTRLTAEREELLNYQNQLDQAQDRLEQQGFSADDADDLDGLLTGGAPDAIHAYLPETDPALEQAGAGPVADDLALDIIEPASSVQAGFPGSTRRFN